MTDVWVVRHWPSGTWWGPNGTGYFGELLMAGAYTQEEAEALARKRSPMRDHRFEDIAMPLADAAASLLDRRSDTGRVMASSLLTPVHAAVIAAAEAQLGAQETWQSCDCIRAECPKLRTYERSCTVLTAAVRALRAQQFTPTKSAARTPHDRVPR